MASMDALIESAARASHGANVVRLSIADDRRDLVHAYYVEPQDPTRMRIVVLDAASAKAIGYADNEPSTPFSGSAPRWIFLLHSALLSGDRGELLIGVTGVLLLTSVLAGLWFAWPPRRGWKAAFSFRRWTRPQQKLYGWHRALGLGAGFVLIAIAVSGAYMSLDTWIDPAIDRHGMTHHISAERFPPSAVSAERALTIASSVFPASPWVRLYLPSQHEPYYRVQLHQAGESRAWLGKTTVSVDPGTGKVLDVYDAMRTTPANRLLDAAFPLHNGEIAGWPGRILVVLVGLSLPTMFVTGLLSWAAKRRRRAVVAQERANAPQASMNLPS
jgi:uncharacterized iron-regulated membrane protein